MNEIVPPRGLRMLDPAAVDRLRAVVGPAHALTDADQQLPYLREWRDIYIGRAAVVLRPGSTEEVARILAIAHETGTAVVPQGGNTGLVGGQIPDESGAQIVISLARMKRVREIDGAGYTMTVEAGLTLAEAQATADAAGRFFPLALPSQGSCTIGGNLSTNAGGVGVLAYGNARSLVLGIEVVLPDGRVWNGLRALKKDNTGYHIRDLYIGAEGTLGIITAATLKLFPKPAEVATAFVALPGIEHALTLFSFAQDTAGRALTAFEFVPRIVLEMVLRNIRGTREPLPQPHPWYVLLEVTGLKADGKAQHMLEQILAEASEQQLILDAAIAASQQQARDLWKLRESISEAQKPEGGNIKHDVSVPIARIPEFITRANAVVERICPGSRPLPLGHFGDGNVHYNICQPVGMGRAAFEQLRSTIMAAVHGIVVDMGGSISAEHGIGRTKRAELARVKDPVELELMHRIKSALDPKGIMNPGKVL